MAFWRGQVQVVIADHVKGEIGVLGLPLADPTGRGCQGVQQRQRAGVELMAEVVGIFRHPAAIGGEMQHITRLHIMAVIIDQIARHQMLDPRHHTGLGQHAKPAIRRIRNRRPQPGRGMPAHRQMGAAFHRQPGHRQIRGPGCQDNVAGMHGLPKLFHIHRMLHLGGDARQPPLAGPDPHCGVAALQMVQPEQGVRPGMNPMDRGHLTPSHPAANHRRFGNNRP